jgi:uncharacterized damage-inducible protein DinB
MNTSTAALKAQFDLHTRLYNNVLDGISDSDANTRSNDHVNHMKWIAGHILNTRLGSFSKMTGNQPDESYVALFGRGVALDPNASYPPIEELKSKWNEVSSSIATGLLKVPEDILSSPATVKTPVDDETVRGLFAFLVSHEAYHIGQLSILRKLAGKPAMSYS